MTLIVFDMDGTLIDTHALIAEHMAAVFANAGLPTPLAADIRASIGLSLPVAMGRLTASEDTALVTRLVDAYRALYRGSLDINADREPLFPGAREALDRLRAQPEAILGIATGKGLFGASRILKNHGLTDYFTTVQTPDHNPSKPHPGMLLRAMDETGAAKAETVMIGDTTFDIELARAAGVAAIGVSWGYHDVAELTTAGAHVVIDSYEQLDDAIRAVLDQTDA